MKFLFEEELPGQVDIFTIQKELNGEELYNQIKNKDDIESWFDILVPQSGKADTAAGELIRAMMRILYRDYNDGDRFFSGYGVETCGGSAQFLIENTDDRISNKLIDIAEDDLDSQDYSDAINEVAFDLINYLKNHKELLSEPNTQDSRDWELEEEFVPKYDFECELPDNLIELIGSGRYSEEDLEGEIYYWESYGDQIGRVADNISVEGNSLYIEGLTEDIYNELNRHMYRWLEDFANDLDAELDDEEYLDKGLENAKYGIIELSKFKKGDFRNFRPVDTLENAKWQKNSLERADKRRYVIFTIDDKQLVEESLHNDEIEQHKKISKEIGLKTLGDLKSFKDHQGSAELDALKDYKKELDLDEALGLKEDKNTDLAILICDTDYDSEYYNYSDQVKADTHLEELKQMSDEELLAKGILGYCYYDQVTDDVYDMYISSKGDYDKIQRCLNGEVVFDESLKEDTIKQNGKWVNKGKEGTHGTFKTKKAADAQRKAMFANGFEEELKEEVELDEELSGWEACDATDGYNIGYIIKTFEKNGIKTIIGKNNYLYVFGNEEEIKRIAKDLGFFDETIESGWLNKEEISKILNNRALDEKLIQGKSDATLKKNIKTEVEAGKDPKQAYAIAKSIQKKNMEEALVNFDALKFGDIVRIKNSLEPENRYKFIGREKFSQEDLFTDLQTDKIVKLANDAILVRDEKLDEFKNKSFDSLNDNDEPYVDFDDDFEIKEQLEKTKNPEKKDQIEADIERINKEIAYAEKYDNLERVMDLQQDLDYLKEDTSDDINKALEETDKEIEELQAFADKAMKEGIKPLHIKDDEEVTPVYENNKLDITFDDFDDEEVVDYVNENITANLNK